MIHKTVATDNRSMANSRTGSEGEPPTNIAKRSRVSSEGDPETLESKEESFPRHKYLGVTKSNKMEKERY